MWELNGALVALVDGVLLDLDADADTRHREGPQSERRAAQLRKLLSSRRRQTGERTPRQAGHENPRPGAGEEDTAGRDDPHGQGRPAEGPDAAPPRRPLGES